MNINNEVLQLMKDESLIAFKNDEIPVSCVIVDRDGNFISKGINDRQSSRNVLGHAEINAIVEAEQKIGDWRLDGYSMIVSLEPCDMCNAVIKESRIDKVYYFLPKKTQDINTKNNINKVEIDGYNQEKAYFLELLTSFFNNKR